MMVGLSVVLETKSNSTKLTQVINKATNISLMPNRNPPPLPLPSPSSSSSPRCSPRIKGNHFPLPAFLEQCFLCGQKLFPGTDIYMYKGDWAFCSEECRYKQIFMDEDDQNKGNNNNCLLMVATRPNPSSTSRAFSSSSSGSSRHNKKGSSRNSVGGFAY